MTKIFKSKELLRLYKIGHLDNILDEFRLNKKTFIGAGGDASAFTYDDEQVIKICSKKVPFFQKYDNNANDLMSLSHKYSNILLPINRILYEDEYIFIYLQYYCQRYDRKVTPEVINNLFFIAKTMLTSCDFITNLSSHNLGIYNNHIVVFDYHALDYIHWNHKKVHSYEWFRILIRHLFSSLAKYYQHPDRDSLILSIRNKLNCSTYQLFSHCHSIPNSYLILLSYITHNKKNLCLDHLLSLIEDCLDN